MNRPIILSAYVLLAALAAAWLLWPLSDPPPWQEEIAPEARLKKLAVRAGPLTAESVASALGILDPDGVLADRVKKTPDHLRVRDPAGDGYIEIPWAGSDEAWLGREPDLRDGSTPGPLAGLRIVLDPGHHGGAWSEIESRHFPVYATAVEDASESGALRLAVTAAEDVDPPKGAALRLGVIREGDLNFATARLLQARLTAAGAEVHLTRGAPPLEPFPLGMDPRFDAEHEARLWLDEARHDDPVLRGWARLMPTRIAHLALERRVQRRVQEDLHALYTRWDLRRRAELAAEVGADLTLSIHYNYARYPHFNYVVVFMPGHKHAGELATGSALHHAVARLLEGDLPIMTDIGQRIGSALHRRLEMPEPPAFAPPAGLRPMRWPVVEDARLFARNLAIVRRTPGPVLLIEGPFMNHPEEAARLLGGEVEVDGARYPERTRSYADAVLEAVIESAPLLRERRDRRAVWAQTLSDAGRAEEAAAGGI